jgi:hypothetical protein
MILKLTSIHETLLKYSVWCHFRASPPSLGEGPEKWIDAHGQDDGHVVGPFEHGAYVTQVPSRKDLDLNLPSTCPQGSYRYISCALRHGLQGQIGQGAYPIPV